VLTSNEAFESFCAAVALIILVAPNLMGWQFSLMKLNGGRPGFPFYLLYTRPVRTTVMVGVPMAYLTLAPAVIYLISALFLRGVFGYPFPLLPAAAWVAVLNVIMKAGSWSTRKRAVQMVSLMIATGVWISLSMPNDWFDSPSLWPTLFAITPAGYALIGVFGLASFGLTVAAVERQRHGDGRGSMAWSGAGFPDHLSSLLRFPCPTSSAIRAQVWFELRSRGLPVLTIGVALAVVQLLLYAVSGPIDALITAQFREYLGCSRPECYYARPLTMLLTMMSVPTVLVLGGNAFGILTKQGRVYASPFDATQPHASGQLAILKVLVRSVCVLAALAVLVLSLWASGSLSAAGEILGVSDIQRALGAAVEALTSYELMALAVAGSIGVAVMVASRATLVALWARYPRHLNMAGSLLLLYGGVLMLFALNGWLDALFRATSWVVSPAILGATVYFAWRGFTDRVLTLSHASGIVLLSAMFAAAWLTLLRTAGVSLTEMPAVDAVKYLSPVLLPLTIGVLAPWSYSRVRHT
jgi:hypothetical protein